MMIDLATGFVFSKLRAGTYGKDAVAAMTRTKRIRASTSEFCIDN